VARRKTNQPRRPPPVFGTAPLGRSEGFFDAADVNTLSEQAGLLLAHGADPSRLADYLTEAFHLAAFHGAFVDGYPAPPSARRGYHAGVLSAVRVLWKHLELPGDPLSYVPASQQDRYAESWDTNLIDPLVAANSADLSRKAAVHATHFWKVQQQVTLNEGEDFDVAGLMGRAERQAVMAALSKAPHMLALLAVLAEGNLDLLRDMALSPGRKPKTFKQVLYRQLAAGYHQAFGDAPETGRDRDQPNCASSIWVDALLCLAANQIPERILLDVKNADERRDSLNSHPLVRAVREEAALAFVTKADALAEGWREQGLDQPVSE